MAAIIARSWSLGKKKTWAFSETRTATVLSEQVRSRVTSGTNRKGAQALLAANSGTAKRP
jgi:hypothetical protein